MLKVKYNIGDFVNIPYSRKPSLIIKIIDNVDYNNTSVDNISNSVNALLSIDEYNGDYLIMKVSDIISVATIDNYEELSILANFGDWFHNSHKDIYDSLIIDTLLER
jgi:hydrogenase maturation factor